MGIQLGAQENEFAISRLNESQHRRIAVAGGQALTYQDAQISGQRRVGIVDRLVLAHEAAQLLRQRACARLEGGILQHLVGLNGAGGGASDRQQQERQATEQD